MLHILKVLTYAYIYTHTHIHNIYLQYLLRVFCFSQRELFILRLAKEIMQEQVSVLHRVDNWCQVLFMYVCMYVCMWVYNFLSTWIDSLSAAACARHAIRFANALHTRWRHPRHSYQRTYGIVTTISMYVWYGISLIGHYLPLKSTSICCWTAVYA